MSARVHSISAWSPPYRIASVPSPVWRIALRVDGRSYVFQFMFTNGKINIGSIFRANHIKLKSSGETYHYLRHAAMMMLREATEAQVAAIALQAQMDDFDRRHPEEA
ncbi:MAG: hypothetical protein E6Q97_15690 [Desulfurellales bacterium]|nr:MAG: hypothetical protein E6Q97_15690 [Desulfurellales bacterium]